MPPPVDVLLVDDRPENLLALEAILESPNLRLVSATSGNDALALMLEHNFAVVLLDVQMPGMDGFETARLMRGSGRTRHVPIIFVTAISKEQKYIFEGYESGAVDYLFKPLEPEIVCSKVQVFAELHRQRMDLDLANQALREINRRIQDDLKMAATVQQSLLPSERVATGNIQMDWKFLPCDVIGGDIFNVFPLDGDHLAFYMLDVSGHGVSASLLSCALSAVLNPGQGVGSFLWEQGPTGGTVIASPVEVIYRLNRRFPMQEETCQFFTILYGVLNTRTWALSYVSAGHPPGLIAGSDGTTRQLDTQSPAVGFLPDGSLFTEGRMTLHPGDRLCLYSDGLIEARDPVGSLFSLDRLQTLWATLRSRPLSEAVQDTFNAIAAWRAGPPDDDQSLLALEICPRETGPH